MRRSGSATQRPWGRELSRTPHQHAAYLEERDGRFRAQEYAFDRMRNHEGGSEQALFWHAVWRLLK